MSQHTSQPSRILIVSENAASCELLEEALTDGETKIQSFAHIRVAWKSIPDCEPDLIVFDFSNSDLSGYGFCRQLKSDEKTRKIPVLMVTSLNELGDIENAVAAGCDDFLTTPLNEQELRTRSHSLIKVKKLRDELKRLRDELED